MNIPAPTDTTSEPNARLVAPAEMARMNNGLRARTYGVGVPLLIAICFVSVYADMVSKTVQFGVLQIAAPALVALLALVLLQKATLRFFKQPLLNRAEMLVIYVMMLMGVMVSTRGIIERIIPAMAYLPYFGNDTNGLHRDITRYLPAWAMPFTPAAALTRPDWSKEFYEGVLRGQPIELTRWVGPLFAWAVLFALVIWLFLCLGTILRRRWVEEERLTFPLTRLPLALINDQAENQPFLRNPMMWIGFVIPVVVFGLNGLAANIPNIPALPLRFDVSPLLTERPWSGMDSISLWSSLAAIGFAYFLPNDLLFSLWFFFLFTRAEDAMAIALGGQPEGIGSHNARIWTGYQAAGAYIILILAQVKLGAKYFRTAWQTAFPDRTTAKITHDVLPDTGELMRYRSAFLGLFTAFAGILLWLVLAGMSPVLALAQMGIYLFLVALVMTRAVSEAGLLMTETSFLPSNLIGLITPLPTLGAQNLSLLALTNIAFARDLRGILLSPLMDSQKMAGEVELKPRALLFPVILSVVVSFVVGSFFFLTFSYRFGHLNLYVYPNANSGNMYGTAASLIRGQNRPFDATAYGGLAVGLVATTLLVFLRARYSWFPFHPLGYAIAPTWAMYVFWWPFFVAWLLKSAIARYGGIYLYRKLAPLMLGMILGEFTMAVFWALMSTPGIGWNAPVFPWP